MTGCSTLLSLGLAVVAAQGSPKLVTYPAPQGEKASADYTVSVNGKPVFVYDVDTLRGGPASFGYFDFAGKVNVTITSTRAVTYAKILPTSYGLTPTIEGSEISFDLDHPCNLTVEINGSPERCLHLFANPIETDAPRPDDPNVIYYGPGVHEIGPVKIASGKTIYIAGGAVVRGVLLPDEKPTVERDWSGVKNYANLFVAEGAKHIAIRGRGILDLRPLSWHARTAMVISNCEDVLVEGITVLDAPAWVVAVFGSKNVTVRNVKQICRRENSDGVDLCNTQDALVEDCFLRNNDDEVCVKTTSPPPAQESRNILVRRCVIWNERARGLGITSETRENISGVTFRDCDIIHDFSGGGDCCSLAILVSDSGTMSDIVFEDIRVEHVANTLICCWIGADMWGHDPTRGHIKGVVYRNITVTGGGNPVSRLTGFDGEHLVENVTFENVSINGKVITSLEDGRISANEHTRNVRVVHD